MYPMLGSWDSSVACSMVLYRTVVCGTLCAHMNVNDELFSPIRYFVLWSFRLLLFCSLHIKRIAHTHTAHANYTQITKHAFSSSFAFPPITYSLAVCVCVCETKPLLAIRSASLMIFNSNNFIVFVRIVNIYIYTFHARIRISFSYQNNKLYIMNCISLCVIK